MPTNRSLTSSACMSHMVIVGYFALILFIYLFILLCNVRRKINRKLKFGSNLMVMGL